MIVILVVGFSFTRFKQKISCDHLENSASKTPNICACIILGANNYFRWSILARLNFRSKVSIGPAPVSHITDLYLNIITKSGTTLHLSFVICYSFLFFFLLFFFKNINNWKILIITISSRFLFFWILLGLRICFDRDFSNIDCNFFLFFVFLLTVFCIWIGNTGCDDTLLNPLFLSSKFLPLVLLLSGIHVVSVRQN